VNLDSSLSVRCSRTPVFPEMALNNEGVEMERSLDTFLHQWEWKVKTDKKNCFHGN